jgi:catechol 2,3-dioxygenase-like lactoylglutathione lyase family enzyme
VSHPNSPGVGGDGAVVRVLFAKATGLRRHARLGPRVPELHSQRVEIVMMRTPDGHSRIELSRFLTPPVVADHRNAPVNALGYLRVIFAVDDLDSTLARLGAHGAQLVGEVVQYENAYRLCYIRGPEGLLIGLAEPLG